MKLSDKELIITRILDDFRASGEWNPAPICREAGLPASESTALIAEAQRKISLKEATSIHQAANSTTNEPPPIKEGATMVDLERTFSSIFTSGSSLLASRQKMKDAGFVDPEGGNVKQAQTDKIQRRGTTGPDRSINRKQSSILIGGIFLLVAGIGLSIAAQNVIYVGIIVFGVALIVGYVLSGRDASKFK